MELSPFTDDAAIIMQMAEEISEHPLREPQLSEKEVVKQVKLLQEMGLDITEKQLHTYWSPITMRWLRDTFNDQSIELAKLVKRLMTKVEQTTLRRPKNMHALTDEELAIFNNAHTKYAATRDLFYGVSRNAAQKLRQIGRAHV